MARTKKKTRYQIIIEDIKSKNPTMLFKDVQSKASEQLAEEKAARQKKAEEKKAAEEKAAEEKAAEDLEKALKKQPNELRRAIEIRRINNKLSFSEALRKASK